MSLRHPSRTPWTSGSAHSGRRRLSSSCLQRCCRNRPCSSSTSLLRRLVQRAPHVPWLLLVCRREETDVRPLDGVDGVETTILVPLDSSSSLELVHALTETSPLSPHEATRLLLRAGGNPL